jgi:hypothetical protein
MAYNESPKSLQELKNLTFKFAKKDDTMKIISIHEGVYEQLKDFRVNPLIFDTSKPKVVNISRSLSSVDIAAINRKSKPVRFKFGDGSNKKTITTAEQEQVTLLIIEEVLNIKTPDYKSFGDMWNDHKRKQKGLYKIHKNLEDVGDWWKHFELQFNEITKTKDFPNSKFDVFNHSGGFMDFISDFITKGTGSTNGYLDAKKFSKKDSWNPADVWLRQNGPEYNKIKKHIKNAKRIEQVNEFLRYAYNNNIIVGISLKKTHGKVLKYEKVNLELRVKDQSFNDYTVKQIKFDPFFDKIDKSFTSLTSNILLVENTMGPIRSRGEFTLSFKSNTGGPGNITYEFFERGAAAQLGKVPKDRLKTLLKKRGFSKGFPTQGNSNYGKDKIANEEYWNKLVKEIDASGILDGDGRWVKGKKSKNSDLPQSWEDFPKNMTESWTKHGGTKKKNVQMMQMVEFLWMLSQIYKKKKSDLDDLITDLFYFAQKKGQKHGFGPFGKLY